MAPMSYLPWASSSHNASEVPPAASFISEAKLLYDSNTVYAEF